MWTVHRSQTIEFSDCYGYGSFKNFMDHYQSIEWTRESTWRKSHFSQSDIWKKRSGYIHAGIVEFNGKGMVLRYPFSWIRYLFWIRKHKLKNKNKKTIDWRTEKTTPPLKD